MNRDQFQRELRALFDVPRDSVLALHRGAHRDVVAGVVARSARDKGELVNGFVSSRGTPYEGESTSDFDRTGSEALSRLLAEADAILEGLDDFDITWITNPVDHFDIVDQGLFDPPNPGVSKDPRPHRKGRLLVSGGFSTQSPEGISLPTYNEVEAKYRAIVEAL